MSRSPTVGIIILNWNSYDDTATCLGSVQKLDYGDFMVFLVDNGSTDGSIQALKKDYNNVNFIMNHINKGFGGGMNDGITKALDSGCEYILLLNNDVILHDESILSRLVETMRQNPDIGILSPKVTSGDKIWFEKGNINWKTAKAHHIQTNEEGIIPTEYVPLCATLIRGEVFEQVGLLPEKYFLYYEDVEFCINVMNNGYDVMTNTDITVEHKTYSSTSGPFGATPTYYNVRNKILFAREHDINMFIFLFYMVYFVASRSLHRAVQSDMRSVIALVRAVVDGLSKKWGKGPYPRGNND